MTKREEIREVIDIYTDDDCLYPNTTCEWHKGGYCVSGDGSYKCLMKRLDELGVVIKVERELPEKPDGYDDYYLTWQKYDEGQESMLEAGYVAVEPLIEEETENGER